MAQKNIHTMKQPELGKRISDLRKEKGLTQEELVVQCNINVRTIQRIEAGEVNPRSYTVKIIFDVLGEEMSQANTSFTEEKSSVHWTDADLKILHKSWLFGIFLIAIFIVSLIVEFFILQKRTNTLSLLILRIPSLIAFILLLIPFLRGYQLLAKKINNSLLNFAVYNYFFTSLLTVFLSLFIHNSGLLSALEIFLSIICLLIFGVAEIILGLGICKLKKNVASVFSSVGTLRIVNGILLLTVILSPVALFFYLPILIFEIISLHNNYIKARESQT